ncbi:MAG: ORF6N domain-containing protein [Oribacterium sp.]
MQLPTIKIVNGTRVLSTKQIAEAYVVKEVQIYQNFKNNRFRFIDGKHYISLTGDKLKEFKNHLENFEVVDRRASHLYFWTEKGALLHAKSLNTDKAWEVYDYLVDHYFRAQDTKKLPTVPLAFPKAPTKAPVPIVRSPRLVVDAPDNAEIQKDLRRIKRIVSAMDLLADCCSVYCDASLYKSKVDSIHSLFLELVRSVNDLQERKPNLVEKPL